MRYRIGEILVSTAIIFSLVGCGDGGPRLGKDNPNISSQQSLTITAGDDQLANVGDVVQLTGSITNAPAASEVETVWVQEGGPVVELLDADSSEASFTAPEVDARTELSFLVTATTATTSDTDIVLVTINAPPIALPGDDQIVQEGSSVLLDGSLSSDADGLDIEFSWEQTGGPAVDLVASDTFAASFLAPSVTDSTFLTFQLSVSDENQSSSSATVEIRVQPESFPTVVGAEVAFEPPPEITDADLSELPIGEDGLPLLIKVPGLDIVVDLDQSNQLTGLGRCLSLVTSCVSPPDRSIDDCMRSAPICSESEWWRESEACCPSECFTNYEEQRFAGIRDLDAFSGTFFSPQSCIEEIRELEEQL